MYGPLFFFSFLFGLAAVFWFQFRGLFLRRLRGRCPPLTGLCMGLVGTRVSVTRTTWGCCFFRLPGGGDLCIFFILMNESGNKL